MPKYKLHKNV